MNRRQWPVAAAALLPLIAFGACSTPRPSGLTCAGVIASGTETPELAARLVVPDDTVAAAIARNIETARMSMPDALRRAAAQPLNYLSLSAGGQWGAFGSGFLKGWTGPDPGAPERPAFDIVTGVSTGAIMAPFVFAGPEYDEALADAYDGVSTEDVARKRSLLSLLSSNSLYDTEPLRRRLYENVTDAFLDEVANARTEQGRSLLIGAVDLDSGAFHAFDLTQVATDMQGTARRECFVEMMLASSAIPLGFPPRFINDAMYVDGGVRRHLFWRAAERATANLRRRGQDGGVNAYMIVHGDLTLPEQEVENGLIAIAGRTFSTIVDEGLKASIYREVHEVRGSPGWRVRGVVARDIQCTVSANDDVFSAEMTHCLYEAGLAIGSRRPLPWLDADQLLAAVEGEGAVVLRVGGTADR